jgi:hypothetical protein
MATSNSRATGSARAGAIATSLALVVVPSFASLRVATASHPWTTATARLAEHSVTVSAKAFPDLSGRWTLDTTALVGSQGTVHVTMVVKITQTPASINIQRTGFFGSVEQDASVNRLAFDGSAAKVVVRTGEVTANATASAGWDDSTLVVTTRLPAFDSSYTTVERFTLGADSKTMSLSVTHSGGGGSVVAGRLLFVLRRE